MLSFSFQAPIADIDETVEGEPCYPAMVLILEMDEDFIRVIVPDEVLAGRRESLVVGEGVNVGGEVKDTAYGPEHVASTLRIKALDH